MARRAFALVPKVPRGRSHADVVRFLKKRGWTIAREGGSHTILRKGDDWTSIPRHNVIKTGTLRQILRQTGITIEEAAEDL